MHKLSFSATKINISQFLLKATILQIFRKTSVWNPTSSCLLFPQNSNRGRGVFSTSWKYFILQKLSTCIVYIFKTARNFLIKICCSHQSFNTNILKILYLKSVTSAHSGGFRDCVDCVVRSQKHLQGSCLKIFIK